MFTVLSMRLVRLDAKNVDAGMCIVPGRHDPYGLSAGLMLPVT
jgi:hypothetical protein